MLVVGDDCKPPWTYPNPEVFLVIISGVEGPNGPPSHFHKGEIRINFITGVCVQVTEIMGQFRRARPCVCPVWRVSQVNIHDDVPTFIVDPHPVLIKGPLVDLVIMLVGTFLQVDLYTIIFCHWRLFVFKELALTTVFRWGCGANCAVCSLPSGRHFPQNNSIGTPGFHRYRCPTIGNDSPPGAGKVYQYGQGGSAWGQSRKDSTGPGRITGETDGRSTQGREQWNSDGTGHH